MSRAARLAAIIGAVIFMTLAGAGAAFALWSTTASTGSTVRVANLNDSCANVTAMQNASFEDPVVPNTYYNVPNGQMPGWRSVDDTGAPAPIEVWRGVTEGVAPPVGNQFVELNANAPGTLYQTMPTTPGQTLQWSLLHRGRAGVDTMELFIGAPGAGVSQGQFQTGMAGWVRYSGAYVVPAGQTSTELSFKAVSTGSGDRTVGNLLDDVSFGSGPCLKGTTAVSNITNPGGAYRVGDVVEYVTTVQNTGSAPASSSVLSYQLPNTLSQVAGSIQVNGAARTDAADGDTADFASATRTLTARLGAGATGTAGGWIAQGTSATVRVRATILVAGANTTINYQPSLAYVNDLAPNWGLTATSTNAPITVQPAADLSVTAAATPTTVNRGTATTATWRFPIANNGPSGVTAATATITIPTSLGTGTPTGTGVTCSVPDASGVSTCTLGAMASGATREIVVQRAIPTTAAVGTVYSVTATVSSATSDQTAGNNTAAATVTVNDTQAPTTPGAPTASGTTSTQTTLTWPASTDNVGVTGYQVISNGSQVASSTGTSVTVTGLTPNTTYFFNVRAVDAAGNLSGASQTVTVTTAVAFNAADFYSIQNLNSNLCVDAENQSTASGTRLLQYTCNTTWMNQRWRFVATTNGYYALMPQYSGSLAWAVQPNTDGTANLNDSRPMQLTTRVNGAQYQEFMPVSEGNGVYHFVIRSSGKCLDVPNASTAINVQLQQFTCNTTPAQSFRVTKVN